jgi:hypothetical protein
MAKRASYIKEVCLLSLEEDKPDNTTTVIENPNRITLKKMIWMIFDKYRFLECRSEAELFRMLYEELSLPPTKEVKDQIQMHARFRYAVTLNAPVHLKPGYQKALRGLHRVFYQDYSTGFKRPYGNGFQTKTKKKEKK